MSRLIGVLALILMFGAFIAGSAADTEWMQALGYGLTLVMMPVTAIAWMAAIAFPRQVAASKA